MRIGVVADVHCQADRLRDVAKALVAEGVDEIVLAGDGHYEYRFSNEVMELVREYGMRYVIGNHEGILLSTAGARAVSAAHVRRQNLDALAAAPDRIRLQVGGKILTIVHANPWARDNTYLYAGHPLLDRCDELDTDYLVLGHTHVPMTERHGRTLVVNPGSLVFSRDPGGRNNLTYAVLDTSTDEVHLSRTPLSELNA